MRRKIIAIALCVMMMSALFLASCGLKKDGFVGAWQCSDENWGEVELTLNEDETAEFTLIGISTEGTWAYNEEDENVTLTTEDFEDVTLEENDGQLSFEFADGTITLDKVEESE